MIVVDGHNLSITDVVLVARRGDEVVVPEEAMERVRMVAEWCRKYRG